MSASGSPTAAEMADELPITPEEASVIVDAMSPVQDLTGVGASVGSAMESAPGSGPKLIGVLLQHGAAQVELASMSIETLARAVQFYIDAQTQTAEQLFPPPTELAKQIQADSEPFADLANDALGTQP